VAIAGNAILQFPIGMLTDKWGPINVMWLATLVSMAMSALLPFTITTILIWPVAFIAGAAAFAIYTAALAVLGDEFKGPELIAGSAAFAATWGVGGIAGPPIVGAAIDAVGIQAVPVFIVILYGVLAALLFLSNGQLVRKAA
jgi:MFS family permease